jgi:hypothetical protein
VPSFQAPETRKNPTAESPQHRATTMVALQEGMLQEEIKIRL